MTKFAQVADQLSVPGLAPADITHAEQQQRRAALRAGDTAGARRCAWCQTVLPPQTGAGRPRVYCSTVCRQQAKQHREATADLQLPDRTVLVDTDDLEGLQDRLFQLRCAIEDAQTVLAEKPRKVDLERAVAELVRAAGRLDQLWVTGRKNIDG